MSSRRSSKATEKVAESFGRSAKLYDKAVGRGQVIAVPFGRYLLLARIKRGGMAEVYRAKVTGSEGFEKVVAIKRILPHLAADPSFVAMFIDEAKLVALLNHRNICPVIELGRCKDGLYIVMEYIWGCDLRQILAAMASRGKLIPIPLVAYMVARVAEGLDFAHRRRDPTGAPLQIVHRDVSPQNILVSFDGEVKVIDFGIARATERSTQTRAGTFKGKFAYMSPEQARGKELDRRSDIFCVGIVLHELITGRRLFASPNDMDTLHQVRKGDIAPPVRPFGSVPDELVKITMKALSRDLDDRYQWANELQVALDHFLMASGELVTAANLGTWLCLNFPELAAKSLTDQEDAARAEVVTPPPDSSGRLSSVPPPESTGAGLSSGLDHTVPSVDSEPPGSMGASFVLGNESTGSASVNSRVRRANSGSAGGSQPRSAAPRPRSSQLPSRLASSTTQGGAQQGTTNPNVPTLVIHDEVAPNPRQASKARADEAALMGPDAAPLDNLAGEDNATWEDAGVVVSANCDETDAEAQTGAGSGERQSPGSCQEDDT